VECDDTFDSLLLVGDHFSLLATDPESCTECIDPANVCLGPYVVPYLPGLFLDPWLVSQNLREKSVSPAIVDRRTEGKEGS